MRGREAERNRSERFLHLDHREIPAVLAVDTVFDCNVLCSSAPC